MSWDSGSEFADTTHWIERSKWIRSTKNLQLTPVLEQVEKELRQLLAFVVHMPVVGMDFHTIRSGLFIPFGGPSLWNRKVDLLVREIEYANDKHFGQGTPVPDWEWTLSGIDRPLEARGGRVVGDEPDSTHLPGDIMETV